MKFKFFGTRIYISFLFAAVIAFLLVIDRTGLIIPTLLAVLIHEIGHLLAMWAMECQPRQVRLVPASVQIVRGFSKKKYGETAIAVCGPAANFVFFIVCLIWYSVGESRFALQFSALNFIIALYNLLPVSGLDGGTILKNLLCSKMSPDKAEQIVRLTAFTLGVFAAIAGIFITITQQFNISIYIVALYLIITSVVKR